MDISIQSFPKMFLKYFIQGLAVAIVSSVIPNQQLDTEEVIMIALTAGSIYLVLDTFAPSVAKYARKGTGFMIGLNLVEGYCNCGSCSSNCQCNGGTEFCGACHLQLGTSDPGRSSPGSMGVPNNVLEPLKRSDSSPPFGIQSIFKANNIFTRNISPGNAENGVPMAANSI